MSTKNLTQEPSLTARAVCQIVERGEDFAVYRGFRTEIDANGQTVTVPNQFTLLENGLHYLKDGRWTPSEDLIEVYPTGAIAQRGPNKAVFSSDLNTIAVFDLEASNGTRLRGGVRALQLTHGQSGATQPLGLVKATAPGHLLPPNRILYPDAFDGISADVILVWKHNSFAQDVVLRQCPVLPLDWDPTDVRLEIVTEFLVNTEPELSTVSLMDNGGNPDPDDLVINFGRLALIVGKAFSVAGEQAISLGELNLPADGIAVRKQWQRTADGRNFLIESISWSELLPLLQDLPPALLPWPLPWPLPLAQPGSRSRFWPSTPAALTGQNPMELVTSDYRPRGLLIDFILAPNPARTTTFLTGKTYYIRTSYYTGKNVTFQADCCLKYKNSAYLLLYGPYSFPATGAAVVFTSRNDDSFGEKITGVAGELDTDGNPLPHRALKALFLYNSVFSGTVRNIRVRWVRLGVQFEQNLAAPFPQTLRDSRFENIVGPGTAAVAINFSATLLNSISNHECNVTNPGPTPMTHDCGLGLVVYDTRINNPELDTKDGDLSGDPNKNSQSEASFVVIEDPKNPNLTKLVATFFDTHHSVFGLGGSVPPAEVTEPFTGVVSPRSSSWAVSDDGGASFGNHLPLPPFPILPTDPIALGQLKGDAGDPVLARDPVNGAIYALVNASRHEGNHCGFRLWKSTDQGTTFTLFRDCVPPQITGSDKPSMTVRNIGGQTHLYIGGTADIPGQAQTGVFAAHSADGGATWNPQSVQFFEKGTQGTDITVSKNGTAYCFYFRFVETSPGAFTTSLRYAYLLPNTAIWSASAVIPSFANVVSGALFSKYQNGGGHHQRSNSANDPEDYFFSNSFPRVTINPQNDRIYITLCDLAGPATTPASVDQGDIYLLEAMPTSAGPLMWNLTPRRVNTNPVGTDQWNPSVAISPNGRRLFVGYYSRQINPAANSLAQPYGVIVDVSDSLSEQTIFAPFPISKIAFPVLFAGATSSTPSNRPWLFDHVWAQTGIFLDSQARYVSTIELAEAQTFQLYQHFCADDYTWSGADSQYFYFAWCDRRDLSSHTFGNKTNQRPDPNVRLAKIAY